MEQGWTLENFRDDLGLVHIERFLDDLTDAKFAALDAALTKILARRGPALAGTNWMRPLGRGLTEFRVRNSEAEISTMYHSAGLPVPQGQSRMRVLLRVFVHFHGDHVCLLLSGYDKGRDPSMKRQQKEIARARNLLSQFQRRQRGGSF